MRKLNIQIGKNRLTRNVYKVSKNSDAYSFFICEYNNLSKDSLGNIIVPVDVKRKKRTRERIHNSQYISPNSPLYDFYTTEYNLIERNNEGIIVPEEEIRSRLK